MGMGDDRRYCAYCDEQVETIATVPWQPDMCAQCSRDLTEVDEA